jgi:hypothetical protein
MIMGADTTWEDIRRGLAGMQKERPTAQWTTLPRTLNSLQKLLPFIVANAL